MRKLLLLLSVGMFIGLTSCSKEEDLGKEKIEDKAEKTEDKVEDKEAVAAQIESDRVLKTLKAHKWGSGYSKLTFEGNIMNLRQGSANSIASTSTDYHLKPKPVGEGNIYCTKGMLKDKIMVFKYNLNPEGTIFIMNIEGQEFKFTITN